jgi:putative RNA 2'-phosphotransferase
MAHQVGSRKDAHPIILLVHAGDAHRSGVVFYKGNVSVWLADCIPAAFISRVTGGITENKAQTALMRRPKR